MAKTSEAALPDLTVEDGLIIFGVPDAHAMPSFPPEHEAILTPGQIRAQHVINARLRKRRHERVKERQSITRITQTMSRIAIRCLRKVCDDLGLSFQEVSEGLGWSPELIDQFRRGVTLIRLQDIADFGSAVGLGYAKVALTIADAFEKSKSLFFRRHCDMPFLLDMSQQQEEVQSSSLSHE